MDVSTELGDATNLAMAAQGKSLYYASRGEWDLALDQLRDAIERIARAGTQAGLIGGALGVAGVALTALGHFESGAICLGASYRYAPGAYERPEQLRTDAAAALVDQLGQARYDTLFAQGADLSADDALAVLSTTLASLR